MSRQIYEKLPRDVVGKAATSKISRDAFLYLDPSGDADRFAQCGTCKEYLSNGDCYLFASPVDADASCGLYVPGRADPGWTSNGRLVTPEEAGYVDRQVRCENCVVGDSLLLVDGAPMHLRNVMPNQKVYTSGGEWARVSARQSNGLAPVVKVTTTHGLTLRVTPDHRIKTVSGWKAAAELKYGDIPVAIFDEWIGSEDIISPNEALLWGAITGDGWKSTRKRRDGSTAYYLGFGFREDMAAAWRPMVVYAGDRFESREKVRYVSHVENFLRVDWRTEAAHNLAAALTKEHVPWEIWNSTKETAAAYLRGLFSADGSIKIFSDTRASVRLFQVTYSLAEEVRILLRMLGMHNVLSVVKRHNKGYKDLYTIAINRARSVRRFVELVGFLDVERQGRLSEVASSLRDKGSIERIRSVVPDGVAEVFDISVPGPNAFYANGLLAHNCQFFDAPARCVLFESLNVTLPDVFDLVTNVHSKGCCNAQTPMMRDHKYDAARRAAYEKAIAADILLAYDFEKSSDHPGGVDLHVQPENATPITLPLADVVTRANVQHVSWELVREGKTGTQSVTVPLADIIVTQEVVDRQRVAKHEAEIRQTGKLEESKAPLALLWDGDIWLLGGHHGCQAAYNLGIKMVTIDLMVAPT